MRRKDNGGLKLQSWKCKSACCYVLWPLEGSRRASQVWWGFSLCSGAKCCDGQETNREVFLVFYQLLWSCKVMMLLFFFFLKKCCLKLVCMLKQKNTKVTMQARTHWRLCTIVIFLCKYMPMFSMLLFISCKWKYSQLKAICLPSCPLNPLTNEATCLF